MRAHSSAYLAALAMLVGGLGCASTTARTDDSPSAAARDTSTTTTTAADTGSVQTPTGTTAQPVDTFMERQGTGAPQDTMGYGGLERPAGDSSAADSTSMGGMDTTSMGGTDTTSMGGIDSTGMGGVDSTTADTSMAR